MKKNFILTVALFVIVTSSAYNEIGDGVNRVDEWEDEKIGVSYPVSFVHSGIMYTGSDIERLRKIVANREQPGYGCYETFASDARSKADYTLQRPYKEVYRGDDNGTRPSVQGKYENDFNAAYQNSVAYTVTRDGTHVKRATEILMAYVNTLEAIVARDQPLLASIMGAKFMHAARMVRYLYPKGIIDENFAKICSMFKNILAPILDDFMAAPVYTSGSWGASVSVPYVVAAVLLSDLDTYRRAVDFYCDGIDNGVIRNYIDGETGQCQENGRDQTHTQLDSACLSVACEIVYKQGTDLYGVLDNRLQKDYGYTMQYNAGHDDVPFKTQRDIADKYCSWTEISSDQRGIFRPVYKMVYNHYVSRKGENMEYTKEVIDGIYPEGYYYEYFGSGTSLFNDKAK